MSIVRTALVLLALLCAPLAPAAAADAEDVVWARHFGVDTIASVQTAKIVQDGAGNVYMMGEYKLPFTLGGLSLTPLGTATNVFLAKFDGGGNVQWARNIGGSGVEARVAGLALDSAGNVVVAGYFGNGTGDLTDGQVTEIPGRVIWDGFLIKYDAQGTRQWSKGFGNSGTATILRGVATDSADNVIVVGRFTLGNLGTLTLMGSADGFLQKFDASGILQGQQQIGGSGADIGPVGIAAHGTDIYVGGSFSNAAMTQPALAPIGSNTTGFMLRYDANLDNTWRQGVGSAQTLLYPNSVAVDGAGNILFSGTFQNSMTTPPLAVLGTTSGFVIKATPVDAVTSSFDWAVAIGGTATDVGVRGLSLDAAGDAYLIGSFGGGSLTNPALPWAGSYKMYALRLAAASGNVRWSTTFTVAAGTYIAGTDIVPAANGDLILAGSTTGDLIDPPLVRAATADGLLIRARQRYALTATRAGTGSGTVTADSGSLACGTTCSGLYVLGTTVALTATPATGSSFGGWSGACTGAAATASVTITDALSCTATFNPIPAPPPPPTPIDLPVTTNGAGQGRIALGAALANPGPGAVITVTQATGAPLPGWMVFDRATLTLSFNVPMPEDLPFQPDADTRAAAAAPPNLVYPPSFLVQAVPLALTVDGRAFSFSMDFHAPRSPTAMTALSYNRTGRSGDGASGRPAMSWDGGQVLFETSANNLFGVVSPETKIGRYHGLSGNRDLLSQTAIPGGGVADAAPGPATAPAVSTNGAFGVFAAAGGGVTLSPTSTLKQIYRTSLAYPRVPLNEAATPAPEMVSTSATGIPADAPADKPAISENGAFVAFESAATNLGWNQGGTQIWRKDMASGAIMLVSSNAQGTAGNGDSRNVSLSWDGRFAAFESTATNLVPGTSGQRIYLKDLTTGAVFVIAPGTTPKLDARASSIVFAASGQIQRYDVATGRITTLGPGDQPSVSADGRFVAWRTTDGITQIRVHDVFRGVSALVSQTVTGAPGNGNSYDPALSGDGASIAFGAQARDLVNGNPLPGQIHLAGNPLALPARTGHWYVPAGGNQAWAIERWGDRAYAANLAYRNDGPANWVAGLCAFVDLGCKGTLNPGPLALATWFPADGTNAVASVNGAANQWLLPYPVMGIAITAMPGLPQSGWWYDPAASGSGVFLQVGTQTTPAGAVSHTAHLSLLDRDTVWYAAEGQFGTDLGLEGTLYRYAGGAPVGQVSGSPSPSATAIGQYRLTFAANDHATLRLPDGSTRNLVRFRF